MLNKAKEVLTMEFPELMVPEFHTADDHFKAVGQCIAAAALPVIQNSSMTKSKDTDFASDADGICAGSGINAAKALKQAGKDESKVITSSTEKLDEAQAAQSADKQLDQAQAMLAQAMATMHEDSPAETNADEVPHPIKAPTKDDEAPQEVEKTAGAAAAAAGEVEKTKAKPAAEDEKAEDPPKEDKKEDEKPAAEEKKTEEAPKEEKVAAERPAMANEEAMMGA